MIASNSQFLSEKSSIVTFPCHHGSSQKFYYDGTEFIVDGNCLISSEKDDPNQYFHGAELDGALKRVEDFGCKIFDHAILRIIGKAVSIQLTFFSHSHHFIIFIKILSLKSYIIIHLIGWRCFWMAMLSWSWMCWSLWIWF